MSAIALAAGCHPARATKHQATPGLPAAARPAASDLELRPFFIAGETLAWKVTYAGVEGGRARMAVGHPGEQDGRRVVAVKAEATSSGLLAVIRSLRDEIGSWVDVDSGVPTRTESASDLAGKQLLVHAARHAGQARADLTVWRANAKPSRRVHRLPSAVVHDPLSALLLLRAWTAPDGARGVFHALSGLRLWRVELAVAGREVLDTSLGRRPAVRVEGVAHRLGAGFRVAEPQPRTFTIWISDDAARVPLVIAAKTEHGEVLATAVSYEAPGPL